MDGNAILELLKTNLSAAMPARVVTREAKDFAQRPQSQMNAGVITLLSSELSGLAAARDLADVAGRLKIYLLAEFRMPESSTGADVETAEWALWNEVFTFLKAPGLGLCPLDAHKVVFSAQRDVPMGWIFAELEYSELD